MNQPDVSLAGVGTHLPGPRVDNPTLVRRFGVPAVWSEWADLYLGTKGRHFAQDVTTGAITCSLADMAHAAAVRAFEAAAGLVTADDVDLLVMATASPDHHMPATVNLVADRLGIDDVLSFQLQSGCTGAMQALDVAGQLLASGRHTTALVIGGDRFVQYLDLGADVVASSQSLQINAMMFGDGVGAALLTTRPAPQRPVLRSTEVRLRGRGRPPGQILTWSGSAGREEDGEGVDEDFKAVEGSAPVMAAEAAVRVLDTLGWQPDEVDFVLPPQLSGTMTRKVLEALDLPNAKEVSLVADIGNTANASAFFQLEALMRVMSIGDRAVGVSVEASKWIRAGYALEMVNPSDREVQ